jgi:holin-like protein
LARFAHVPLPGPVLGMALLAVILAAFKRIPDGLATTSDALLKAMPLFFIPAGVGILTLSETFRAAWLPIVVALVGSTAIAMAVTALVMKAVLKWRGTK